MNRIISASAVALMVFAQTTMAGNNDARPICDGLQKGVCFVPIAMPPGSLTFDVGIGDTGWIVFATYMGNNNWFQGLPNGNGRVHIDDQEAVLGVFNVFTGEIAAGTGHAWVDIFWDGAAASATCPAVVSVSGYVDGDRLVEARFQTIKGNPGGASEPWGPPENHCFIRDFFVEVE
jgi:hypothetical protein